MVCVAMLACLTPTARGFSPGEISIVGNPLTSVLHPDLTRSYDENNPCGTTLNPKPKAIETKDVFHQMRGFETGMTINPTVSWASRNKTMLCMRTSNDLQRLEALADERYRLQFSVDGVNAIYTEQLTSQLQERRINLRLMGVLPAQPSYTLGGAFKHLTLSHLKFSVYGKCSRTDCAVARVEVIPTYIRDMSHARNKFTYSYVWTEVNDLLAERLQDLFHRDDEAQVAIFSIILSLSATFFGALFIVGSIRRKLVPFLRAGSSCWATLPCFVWKSLSVRTAYSEMEQGLYIDDGILMERVTGDATSKSGETGEEYDQAGGVWRTYINDVLRPPSYTRPLAIIVGAGSYAVVTVAILVLLAACGLMVTWNSIIVACIVVSNFTTPVSTYMYVRVLAQFRKSDVDSLPRALVSTFLLPLLFGVSMGIVNMRRITTDAANKLELLPFTLVIIIWCFVGYAGGFIGYRMAHMWAPAPALRVNPIQRPLEPIPLLARVVSLVMGGIAYVAVAFPFFWVINASWGSHATTGAALVLATGIAGCAVIVVGSILLTFILLNSGHHTWVWHCIIASSTIGLYTWFGSIIFIFVSFDITLPTILIFCVQFFPLAVLLSVMCAAVGFLVSLNFINSIYAGAKLE